MTFSYFSRNGKILPIKDASISLQNIEYMYGFGVYESLKVRHRILYFPDLHVDRLLRSAAHIGLEHIFVPTEIISSLRDLATQNAVEACNMKMLLIGAPRKESAELIILPTAPLYPPRKLYTQGCRVNTTRYERWYPHAKTLNMLPSYIAYRQAEQHNCYDALLLDSHENILEGTRTNVFAIRGKHLLTPPVEKVLEGVTRITVLHVARMHGYTVKEEDIPLRDMSSYDGVFLTSTSSKIMPIREIRGVHMYEHISPHLKELMKHYETFLEESRGIFSF